MFKVPNVSSGYSKDEIICAIKRRGYSQEDAEVIHRYGAMTIKELRMLFNSMDTLLTPMLSDSDLRMISARAKNNKLDWVNHYTALIKASKFVSVYTEEVIEFILEDPATYILKQEYLLNSPTGKSLTDKEAYLLAVKKRLLRIEAERQLQTGTAKKGSMASQTGGNGSSDSAPTTESIPSSNTSEISNSNAAPTMPTPEGMVSEQDKETASAKPESKPRKRKTITQRAAAKAIGCSESCIKKWERGEGMPHGYPGRGDLVALQMFAAQYRAQKAANKTARNMRRASTGYNIDSYGEPYETDT